MSRRGWDFPNDDPVVNEEDSGLQGRLFFFRLIIIVILSILLYRVYWLQQTQGPSLQAQAEDNRFARLLIDPPRGIIVDRNGEPIAVNESSFNVVRRLRPIRRWPVGSKRPVLSSWARQIRPNGEWVRNPTIRSSAPRGTPTILLERLGAAAAGRPLG